MTKSKRATGEVRILPVTVRGEIRAGESLCERLLAAARSLGLRFQDGDILVVKHKVVSKAEGALVALDEIRPSAASRVWARRYGLDARVCELALRESRRIVRRKRGVLITETKHGFICANAGVDLSNVDTGWAALLPEDPDRSARRIRDGLRAATGVEVAVIISDTFGRPWRQGLTDVAIGCAGIAAVVDLRGTTDDRGRTLMATEVCVVDEIAGAAELVMGKADGIPVAVVRGVDPRWLRAGSVRDEIIRPAAEDLFR